MMARPDIAPLLRSIRIHLDNVYDIDAREPTADAIRDDAAAYAGLVSELNDTLAEVSSLIDRGLRHEAIELAESQGDLNARYQELDFPELSDWLGLIVDVGLTLPYELDYDSLAKLNQASGTVTQLTALMRQNRVAALARAPLSDRIRLLAELVRQDPQSPAWQADLVVLQRARVDQLTQQIEQATNEGDLTSLQRLRSEITETDWWVPVPADFTTRIDSSLTMAAQQQSIDQLRAENDRLQEAYAAFDVPAAASIAKSVRKMMASTTLPPDDPTLDEIQMAMDWIKDQQTAVANEQRAKELIGDLEQTLDQNGTKFQIEESLAAAESLGERLPLPLRVRARERIESFELVARRKTMAAVAVVAMTLIASASGIGYIIVSNREAMATNERDQTFARMIEDQRYEDAKKFLAGLSDDERKLPNFVDGITKIEDSEQVEADRVQAFADVLQQLKADDSGKPNYALVSRLRKISRLPSEKNIVAVQEARAEELRLQIREKKSVRYGDQFDRLHTTVNGFLEASAEHRSELENEKRFEKAQSLRRELRDFEDMVRVSHKELADSSRQLDRLLGKELQKINFDGLRDLGVNEITRVVGDVEKFSEAIDTFRNDFPDDPLTAAFEEDGGLDWKRKWLDRDIQWIKILNHRVYRQPKLADVEQTTDWLQQIEQTQQKHGKHAWSERLDPLMPFYRRIAGSAKSIEKLRSTFDSQLMDEIYIYPHRGAHYYSDLSPTEKRDVPHRIHYFTNRSLDTKDKNFGSSVGAVVNSNAFLSGQSKFAMTVGTLPANLKANNFTGSSYKMLDAIHDVPTSTIDPICKLDLIRRILSAQCEGSEAVRRGFLTLSSKLDASGFPWDTNWLSIDTKDPELKNARQRAQKILSEMKYWDRRLEKVREEYASFLADRPAAPTWIGWVSVEDGKPIARIHDDRFSGQLVVVLTKDASIETIDLGSAKNGKLSQPLPDQAAIAGLAVYGVADPN